MTLSNYVDLITGVAVLIGLLLAANEVRQFRQSRERESAIRLFETFQRPEVSAGTLIIFRMPDKEMGLEELTRTIGEKDLRTLTVLATALEGLGVLVKNHEIKLSLAEEYFGGVIVLYWRRMRKYIQEIRETSGRETFAEYIQWIAERLIERETSKPAIPAHIEFADWEE